MPELIDSQLSRCGAQRLARLGRSDTSVGDMFSDLETWMDEELLPQLATFYPAAKSSSDPSMATVLVGDAAGTTTNKSIIREMDINLGDPPRILMRKGFVRAIVTESYLLSSPGVPEKRHLELHFPEDFTYEAGYHLHVLPRNSPQNVQRVLAIFNLEEDNIITVSSSSKQVSSGLPVDTPITAADLFGAYVELKQGASPKNIRILADAVQDGGKEGNGTRAALLEFTKNDKFKSEIRDKQLSILDLLERFPMAKPSLSTFIGMLTRMRPRVYSLSSAPGFKPQHGTLTYTVVGTGPSSFSSRSRDGDLQGGTKPVLGLASNYLASLAPGQAIYVSLHHPSAGFHLPKSPSTPVIMIAAGTGLAPFRGFLQARSSLARQTGLKAPYGNQTGPDDTEVGTALLFYGCRGPSLDSMYEFELDSYEAQGLVTVYRSYSRDANAEYRYIDECVNANRRQVAALWKMGANVVLCGGKKMTNAVFDVLGQLLWETDRQEGITAANSVEVWKRELERGRYVEENFV